MKKAFIVLGMLILGIQFYQPVRNVSAEHSDKKSLFQVYAVPDNIQTMLKTSCFDCHSNSTNYPWYSYIQPIRLIMDKHIYEGQKNLNFDLWADYSVRKQKNKIKGIIESVTKSTMPLESYTWMHQKAILDESQKTKLISFLETVKP